METRTILSESVEMEIVIKFDVVTGDVAIKGCDKNPIVALGMLDYALARVRRSIAIIDMQQDAARTPRVALASGIPQ